VAVDSRWFRAALFLAPAVKPVIALIERSNILGGLHRYPVAAGDFYPVQTAIGTYILIRSETGTEQTANRYLVVPATPPPVPLSARPDDPRDGSAPMRCLT
jgi:hypothetical protein